MPQPSNLRSHLKAFILYAALVSAFYAPVVFGGKTVQSALIQPHGMTDGRPYGYDGRVPVNLFNVDLPTPAWYEWPINKTVGDIYKKGEFPLWNPYQAGGTPLIADYSTRALFPYQVLEDISSPLTWDYFLLGRVFLAGFFTYLFLSAAGLPFRAAFLGGLLYMFSGVFGWFLNLEQLSNVAMSLPILMAATEYFMKKRGMREAAFMGFGVALVILAGQPEAALYALLLWALYMIMRSISLYGREPRVVFSLCLKSVIALVIGLLLSSPLTVPFLQNVRQSYTLHPGGAGIGLEHVGNWKKVFGVLTPTATEVPADPSILPGALAPFKEASGEVSYFRVFATKGAWDYLGGYTGVVAIFLALSGALMPFRRKGGEAKAPSPPAPLPSVLFFLAFALLIVLKNFGVKPFLWLGALPLFDRSWSPRWSSPSWIFALSAAGALGFEALSRAIAEDDDNRKRVPLPLLLAFFSLFIFFITQPLASAVSITLARNEVFSPVAAGYVIPSILLGNIWAAVILIASFLTAFYSFRRGDAPLLAGIIPLAALELWWDMPRGYGAGWLYLKSIPFALGLLGVIMFSRKRPGAFYALTFVSLASFLLIDLKSPQGLPKRFDPFTEPPYVKFLKDKPGEFRVAGGYGVLVPNYAGAAGLKDLRYINALVDPGFLEFRRAHLQGVVPLEELGGSALWFTGMPQRITVNYDATAGVYYKFTERGFEKDLIEKLPYYSMMGVRFILLPSWVDIKEEKWAGRLQLIYDKEIRVYENPEALPRAFVVFGEGVDLPGPEILQSRLVRKTGIREASIKEYLANSVTVAVKAERPGLLVLTDVLSPGWKAHVNGEPAGIIPVNGFLRGVYIKGGDNTVVFRYSPGGFRAGLTLFAVGAVISVAMIFSKRKRG